VNESKRSTREASPAKKIPAHVFWMQMWPGGPVREVTTEPRVRFKPSDRVGLHLGKYVCSFCRQPCPGLYRAELGWFCKTCKRRAQVAGMASGTTHVAIVAKSTPRSGKEWHSCEGRDGGDGEDDFDRELAAIEEAIESKPERPERRARPRRRQ